jgi:CheY-like chemotaxis protein
MSHEGSITVDSHLGTGSTFYVYLPATEKPPATTNLMKPRIELGKGRILLMDDDDNIRELGEEVLTYLGYQVESAHDGQEAINRFRFAREVNKPFDAVIVDLTIPGGMGGLEAVEKLLAMDPELKAIVSSGYSNDPVLSNYRQYGFCDFVAKPYSVEELAETLKRVLDSSV